MTIAAKRRSPLQGWSTPFVTAIDLSLEPRWGCKGPGAAAWLQKQGNPAPSLPNTWDSSDVVAAYRIGRSEFLLEGQKDVIDGLRESPLPSGVFPVLRDGAALRLQGDGVPILLRQVCGVNFAALDLGTRPVVLTNMIGVSVIAVPESELRSLRLWFDGSFGHYFQETLRALAGELRP